MLNSMFSEISTGFCLVGHRRVQARMGGLTAGCH